MSRTTARTILIVGPGWLGAPTAATLAARGDQVWVLHRSPSAAPDGCTAIMGAVEHAAEDLQLLRALPSRIDALVLAVAPARARGESHAIYPVTAEGAVRLAERLGVERLLQVSSTGVYNRDDGAVVREDTPLLPGDLRVQALQGAEQIVCAAATATCAVCVVRPAGLYGPGRDPAPRFLQPHGNPHLWCNFSWRDDVISAIDHLLRMPPAAQVTVYNCTDNVPTQAGAIVAALTGQPFDAASDAAHPSARSHQRICSDALIATGWRPTATSIFDGLRRLGHDLPGLEPAS